MPTAFRLVVPLIRGFAMRPGKTITIARLLAFCAAISVAACQPSWVALPASETAPVQPAGVDESEIVIYVMSNGWHSEIVVARAELPAGAVPEAGGVASKGAGPAAAVGPWEASRSTFWSSWRRT